MSCTGIVCGTGIGNSNLPKPGDPDNTSVLSAVGVSGGVNVSWSYPLLNPYAVAYVDVFRSDSNVFGTAIKRARISGDFYFDRIGPTEIKPYFYWIQITSVNGTEGEIIGPASATPAASLQEVLDQLNGVLDDSYLSQVLRAKIDKISLIESDLGEEVNRRLLDNVTLGEALSAVQSETGQALTYIQEEITQRTSSDEALLNSVNTLAVGMADNAAAIVEEQTLRVDADTALASDITTLYSNVGDAMAAVTDEATARSDADTAIASSVTSLSAVVDSKIKTYRQTTMPTVGMTTGDLWFDTDDNNKPYRYSGTVWEATDDPRVATNAAAITNEASARADADDALAGEITTIQTQLSAEGSIGGAIVTAQTTANTAVTTANSKVKTFFQTSAPTATGVGDLWMDLDDNNRIYRWSGIAWVDAHDARISSTAATVTTLQTTVNGHTTAIETQANSIDGLSAQYTVKIDNNGYVSGFGLASSPVNGAPYSEFAILANVFKFGAPDGTKTPFAVVDTGGGVYKTLLNSDVIIGGNVDIANLNTGSLPSDVKLRLGDGIIDLDGSGEIRVYKDLSANADYVKLSAGELRFMRYIAGSYRTYNYLSRLESGIANSGTTVAIPGYWKTQPRVMVSPAMMNLYQQAYAGQDQAINCQANNIRETSAGSGEWLFDANATLNLAAASGGTAINVTSGAMAGNTYTTASRTTPANCTTITPLVTLKSSRGNGSSQYYRRSIRWRVEYLNGTWISGAWNTMAMGDQLGTVTSSAAFTFPSAGTWQWRIAYEAFDTNGTVFGAIEYDYPTPEVYNLVTNQTGPTRYQVDVGPITWPQSVTDSAAIPFAAISGTGEIYEKVYSLSDITANYYGYSSAWPYNDFNGSTDIAIGPTGGQYNAHFWARTSWELTVQNGCQYTVSGITHTVSGINLPATATDLTRYLYAISDGNVSARLTIGSGTVTVKRRVPKANSTTPSNTYELTSYTYALTSAQVLATGSMNWMAVGE